jgi:hypothetical protein
LISNLDSLVGVIFLPRLEAVYLEDNPVMKQHRPNHLRRTGSKANVGKTAEVRGILQTAESFNLFKHLQEAYGIRIGDQSFCPSKVHFTDSFVTLRPLLQGGGIMRPLKKLDHRTLESLNENMTRRVVEPPPVDSAIKARQMRRKYKFTEEDIKNICDSGKIPSMKKLMKLRKNTKVEKDIPILETTIEEPETDNTRKGRIQQPQIAELVVNSDIHYDPDQKDATFLTGVHITGGHRYDNHDSSFKEDESGSELSWSEDEDDLSGSALEAQGEEEYLPENVFPNTIQASVRALRHALNNPVSYWRVREYSYLKPTFASKSKRLTADHKEDYSAPPSYYNASEHLFEKQNSVAANTGSAGSYTKTPANSLWTPVNERQTDHEHNLSPAELLAGKNYAPVGKLGYKLDLQKEYHMTAIKQVKWKENAPKTGLVKGSQKYEQLSKIAALKRAKNSGRFKSSDDFDEMDEMMNMVESKMNAVEVNLSKC